MNPLVLIPGLSNTAELWSGVLEHLPSQQVMHAECAPLENIDAIAADLLARLPERFALAGYSFGGYVALAIMARAPQRVERLALLSTGASADAPDAKLGREKLLGLASAGRYGEITARLHPFVVHASRVPDAELLAQRERMASDYGAACFIAHSRAIMARPDRSELLPRIAVPALVAVGRDDKVTPLAGAQAMAIAIPGAQLAVFEDCGHMAPLERPAELAAALRAWSDAGVAR